MGYCPAIDWVGFFRNLDGRRQEEFEADLAARELSLGEYMEIIEQAAMEAGARFVRSGSESFENEALLGIASAMLTHYVKKKKVLSMHTLLKGGVLGLSEFPSPTAEIQRLAEGMENGKRLQLRLAIHNRIEDIKSGFITP